MEAPVGALQAPEVSQVQINPVLSLLLLQYVSSLPLVGLVKAVQSVAGLLQVVAAVERNIQNSKAVSLYIF
jgi:hypothetical protein